MAGNPRSREPRADTPPRSRLRHRPHDWARRALPGRRRPADAAAGLHRGTQARGRARGHPGRCGAEAVRVSGHRVELHVAFTVGDEDGRSDAEAVLWQVENADRRSRDSGYTDDFTVTKGTVDGNGWHERWPETPPEPEPFFEPGKTYFSANRAFEFTCERIIDGVAIGYEREFDPRWKPE